MREQPVEENPPNHPVAAVLRRGQRPRPLHHRSELDARRAGGFAGTAVEALVDVCLEAWIIEGRKSQRGFLDLPHAAAGTVALVVEDPEGRALRQAEAAMDAVPDQVHIHPGRGGGQAVALQLLVEIECGELWHWLSLDPADEAARMENRVGSESLLERAHDGETRRRRAPAIQRRLPRRRRRCDDDLALIAGRGS